MMKLTVKFKFSAAHHLPNYDGECSRPHGHLFRCKLTIAGTYNEETGMICDFKILKKIIDDRVVSKLDHTDLNDIFENPTAENIVLWIMEALFDDLDKEDLVISKIELWESDNCSVEFDLMEELYLSEEKNT